MSNKLYLDCITGIGRTEPLSSEEIARRAEDALEVLNRGSRAAQFQANVHDVQLRFAAHALKGKTPAEIYTLVQGRIDGWSNLAAAKSDLRDWLPLLAAGLACMVMERDG